MMLVDYRSRRENEHTLQLEEHRQQVAAAADSPGCAKATADYENLGKADLYARNFYDSNILPVVCRAEDAKDPSAIMLTREERIAAQAALLMDMHDLMVKNHGVSESCANVHAHLDLAKWKAELGWIPLLTASRMNEYFLESYDRCPPEHVILDSNALVMRHGAAEFPPEMARNIASATDAPVREIELVDEAMARTRTTLDPIRNETSEQTRATQDSAAAIEDVRPLGQEANSLAQAPVRDSQVIEDAFAKFVAMIEGTLQATLDQSTEGKKISGRSISLGEEKP